MIIPMRNLPEKEGVKMISEWETLCLDRMKRIIAAYGDQSEMANISEVQIHEAYKKMADGQILVPGSGARKIKSLLCNLDNLRLDFKSRAEPLLFEEWYKRFKEIDQEHETELLKPPEEKIKPEKPIEIAVREFKSSAGTETEEKATVALREKEAEALAERSETPSGSEFAPGVEKPEIQSPTMPIFFKKRKEDLFDKFLNIVAIFMERFVRWE